MGKEFGDWRRPLEYSGSGYLPPGSLNVDNVSKEFAPNMIPRSIQKTSLKWIHRYKSAALKSRTRRVVHSRVGYVGECPTPPPAPPAILETGVPQKPNQDVTTLPVEAPMAPIRTAGTAIKMHPNEAKNDSTLAPVAVLHDNTR